MCKNMEFSLCCEIKRKGFPKNYTIRHNSLDARVFIKFLYLVWPIAAATSYQAFHLNRTLSVLIWTKYTRNLNTRFHKIHFFPVMELYTRVHKTDIMFFRWPNAARKPLLIRGLNEDYCLIAHKVVYPAEGKLW